MIINDHLEKLARSIATVSFFKTTEDDIKIALTDQCVHVDVSNVARWIFVDAGQEEWNHVKDFPTTAPPWTNTWYEYKMPQEWLRNYTNVHIDRVGVLAIHHKNVWISRDDLVQIASEEKVISKEEKTKWVMTYHIFITSGHTIRPVGGCVDYLDSTGRAMIDLVYSFPIKETPDDEDFSGEELSMIGESVKAFITPVLFGITLAHCKNVKIVEAPAAPPAVNKKRVKSGKKPLVRFRTLVIDPIRTILKKEGKSESQGLKHALHICRGHFKDYTEGRGLFGKHKGLYWWEMRVKASANEGVVVKDYKIEG